MNAQVGRRSVVSAVITAAIAHWMTYVFPATVTTYRGAELALGDNSVMQRPARACHGHVRQRARTFLFRQLQQGFARGRGGDFDRGWV